ncbi:MAG: carbamoyl phosphate synthetase [Mucilaginibacter sp.]|nr:carbamoyl phosphate synthetase [Mucilaginibacter sp.]
MKNQFNPNKNQFISPKKLLFAKLWLLTVVLICYQMLFDATNALAQDGASGINQATTMVKGYFDAGCNLMYAIGAVLGIVGAIKVYRKWNEGEPDTNKVAAAWFGSCIFLVVVATVIKSFFGL